MIQMELIENLKISIRYKKLIEEIDGKKIYDGRGKGVDVYTCDKCGFPTLTRYKDKGVTPYVMRCSHCDGNAKHSQTISETRVPKFCAVFGVEVYNWVRPPLEWLLKHKRAADHVLNGGLVLEREISDENSKTR